MMVEKGRMGGIGPPFHGPQPRVLPLYYNRHENFTFMTVAYPKGLLFRIDISFKVYC